MWSRWRVEDNAIYNSGECDSRVYEAVQDQNWQRVDGVPEFRRCTKKHALVPFDLMNRIQAADLEFDLEVDEMSKLSGEVQELCNELTNVTLLKEVVKQSIIGESKNV